MARLSRAGVSIDTELLEKYDRFITAHGFRNRSEAVRRMIRDELARSDTLTAGKGVVGVVTLVCSRHSALLRRIAPARLYPDSGCEVLSAVHVCVDDNHALAIVTLQGALSSVERTANLLVGAKGVLRGSFNIAWEQSITRTAC